VPPPPLPPIPPLPVPPPNNASDFQVELLVHRIDRDAIIVEKPFSVSFHLTVSATVPLWRLGSPKCWRSLTLAVQHVQPPRVMPPSAMLASNLETSGHQLPSSTRHLNPTSGRQDLPEVPSGKDGADGHQMGAYFSDVPLLPLPFAEGADELNFAGSTSVVFLGTSAIVLEPIQLFGQGQNENDESVVSNSGESDEEGDGERVQAVREFDLSYLPLRKGFTTFGGLRVLLVEDRLVDDEDVPPDGGSGKEAEPRQTEARTLEEWSVVGEIWVNT